ncbi:MAG: PAS domain-containing protein [Hydrogenophaga sp.]|uniref:sensor histidine kinase n=1 Tax=Hydrogenophaga sp. TaxID=1904254 RepID=UPI0025BC0764|nr:PAS domain S-box protein [Hydrogenophaga sp.]MBT9554302.1 PAS domain-containing protein [Hydrogenophaga sp.]
MNSAPTRSNPKEGAIRVALVYAVFAGLWILLSDRAMGLLFSDPEALVRASMAKGWFFVAVTTLLLYVLVGRLVDQLNTAHQREQAEAEEKRRAMQLLAAIAKSSSDAIFAKDDQGRYLLVNNAAAQYMGKSTEDLLGQDDRIAFPAEQAAWIMSIDRRVFASGQVETNEECLNTAQGERVFLATKGPLRDAHGHTFGTFGIARDITGRRKTQQDLRDSEERLRLALVAGKQGLYDLNLETGDAMVSEDYSVMLGHDPQSFKETFAEWRERLHPDDRVMVLKSLDGYVAGQLPAYRVEYRLRTHDGGWKWILSMGVLHQRSAEGRPLRMLGTHTDIHALKTAEAALRDVNATLEARVAERTAELTAANHELETFAYAVSHDLRAPLRAMGGYAQALQEDCGASLQGQAKTYLDQMALAVHKMSDLIDGLLALSRSTRGDLRQDRVDLSALARRRLTELAVAEPGRQVALDIEDGLVVQGDERMLDSALSNLLDNAWKYTGATAASAIRVHWGEVGGLRGVCVSDNGAGFDMAHADRLFKPFQRLHRQDEFPGIGIGLATVQRIVRRHGGEIAAHAVPGKGATFCIAMPQVTGHPDQAPTS